MKHWLILTLVIGIDAVSVGRLTAQSAPAPPATPKAHAASYSHRSGRLGVGVVEIDEDRAKALNLKEDYGVEVKAIDEGSPAGKSGLKVGDVVLEYNGQRIEGVAQFVRMVRETPPGRKVTLAIVREGREQTLSAVMGAAREEFHVEIPEAPEWPDMPSMPNIRIPPNGFVLPDVPTNAFTWRQRVLGIEAESLTGQLAEYFGVKAGVLVRSVEHNSPAEKAGLKAGDVVTRVGNDPISTPQELSGRLRGNSDGAGATLAITRNHRELSLTVHPSGDWHSDGWQNQGGQGQGGQSQGWQNQE